VLGADEGVLGITTSVQASEGSESFGGTTLESQVPGGLGEEENEECEGEGSYKYLSRFR
jgi:hypothetical protein